MSHDFWARVGGDREALFREVFGDNLVPICSPVGAYALLPGLTGPQYVYLLALDQLSVEQRVKLVRHIALRFGYPVAEVERDLDAEGMPILARDASVIVHNPQRWLPDDLPLPTEIDGADDDQYRDAPSYDRFDDEINDDSEEDDW